MKTNEITAADYQRTMSSLWNIVRGYCDDDEEATNTLTGAVENYIYDTQQGASTRRAINNAMSELGVEMDYAVTFAEGIVALNPEPSWEEDSDEFVEMEGGALNQHEPAWRASW